MEFVGADADFRAQAEFAAVVETRAGVDHHRRAVDPSGELLRGRQIAGHDRVGMMRAVVVDVLDRVVERADHAAGDDRAEIFGRVIFLGGRFRQRHELTRLSHRRGFRRRVAPTPSPCAAKTPPPRRRAPTAIPPRCTRPSAGTWS